MWFKWKRICHPMKKVYLKAKCLDKKIINQMLHACVISSQLANCSELG